MSRYPCPSLASRLIEDRPLRQLGYRGQREKIDITSSGSTPAEGGRFLHRCRITQHTITIPTRKARTRLLTQKLLIYVLVMPTDSKSANINDPSSIVLHKWS
ncbi:hypothetical protein AVEN_135313-1 [Araneus ventricosus]|uniref:Uncharacterized protein n=1 Tax=Araneus ventricosus TaxID=182803 RepID=A0A4Y2QZ61_ARAVE|nr:hypothetical protein AVEN_135313-1 [Araneus ventricosus]